MPMLDNISLVDVLKFSTLNDLRSFCLANRYCSNIFNSHKRILSPRFYHLRSFKFTVLWKDKEPSDVPEVWRDWKDAPCFSDCHRNFAADKPNFLYSKLAHMRMTLYTHGSMPPILFDYSAKPPSDPLNSAHFLHLLWHIKDTIFDEECFLEFPLHQPAIRKLLELWNSRAAEQWDPSPLLKCASRLKIGAHAPLETYHRSMLVPYKQRVFSAPVVHFTTYATCVRQLRAKHSLRDFVQYFQKTTDALPNDIDIRCELDLGCGCALHPQEQQDSLDLVLEKAPRFLAPDGFAPPGLRCLTPVVLEQLLSCLVDYVYLGHFSNELLGKQFHVLLYNGLLLKKSGGRDEEVFTCYRIWSEDLTVSLRK